jgi:hypothetical protein
MGSGLPRGTSASGCCMMRMRLSRTRSRLMTLFAVLAALGQLAVSVVAPLGEVRTGQSAPAHVEAQGITKHYAHNEGACVACSVTSLLSLPSIPRALLVEIARDVETPIALERAAPQRAHDATSPRAPPTLA